MGKPPKGTPGKKPLTPSTSERQKGMSLGNMRSLGPRSLDVTCTACGRRTIFNLDDWPDEVLVQWFAPRMRCSKCGHRGANVRPDWTQLRAAPRSRGGDGTGRPRKRS
jgi:hypothetical protein